MSRQDPPSVPPAARAILAFAAGALLATVSPAQEPADGVDLRIAPGPGSLEVTLSWTGGQPSFRVFRSASPQDLGDLFNLIGETPDRTWVDSPPEAKILYYRVTSPCVVDPPERCDGVDNDCDGSIDEPGAEESCAFPNASAMCVSGTCSIGSCNAGWVDLDQSPANGCEYQCTATGADVPDPSFADSNCDGIDGDIATSIFVSPLGSDTASGLWGAPVRSLGAGIERATGAGFSTVIVASSLYSEIVTLANGVSLYGGYSSGDWSRSYSNLTLMGGGSLGGSLFGVRALDITLPTTLDGFTINPGSNTAAGGSVYGIYASGSSSALVLSHLGITSGNGGNGAFRGNGVNGASGDDGTSGQTGCDGCSSAGFGGTGGASACGQTGGGGGRGGYDTGGGGLGAAGSTSGGTGGAGGRGAQGCGTCSSCVGRISGEIGGTGSAGALGANGANGGAGSGAGSIVGGLWAPGGGGNGVSGTHGRGGGGGGGGGGGTDLCYEFVFTCFQSVSLCTADRAGGGGAGGGGGCGGTGGLGGQGGGGSFGIFLFTSSPDIRTSTITTGTGGAGGTGGTRGTGGAGGTRGLGGFGPADAGNGGNGGSGGIGGNGGHGGGGGGGVTYGIYRAGSSSPTIAPDVAITPGTGGNGGTSPGSPGQQGNAAAIF